MATVEFITKRIEGKEKEIKKLEAKLERIRKVEAQNWEEPNPYYYSEYDLKCCLKDLDIARKSLADYNAQLISEHEKNNSRNIQVIIDFLENWKKNTTDFYTMKFEEYLEAYAEYLEKNSKYCKWHNNGGWRDENRKEIEKEYNEYCERFRATWNFIREYVERRTFNHKKFQKDLEQEANRKYDFIIERTNYIVGQITNASNLYIGDKGDLNGYIIGTRGTAKVQTIGAGGYNIQCFHFRTLINSMK